MWQRLKTLWQLSAIELPKKKEDSFGMTHDYLNILKGKRLASIVDMREDTEFPTV